MTSKEVVLRSIRFEMPDRLAYDFPEKFGSDFANVGPIMFDKPLAANVHDENPKEWIDEWGVLWRKLGNSVRGEVKGFPINDWKDFESYKMPDFDDPKRWEGLENARANSKDKFLLGNGIEIYERIHFLRGLENTWADIYFEREYLETLLDKLVDINIEIIKRYAKAGVDGFISCDDWGLQDRIMIAPKKWREIWKPRYARMYKAAHDAGLHTFLHSCGYIVDVLDDLIEVGLDVIHMDQQENMGLELLGKRFGGRLTFFSPVDIQKTMANGDINEIKSYCREMVKHLWRPEGGFIPRWYTDPVGAGHSAEALDAMCEEFLKISREKYGK